ncbi:hypothetical protein KKHLCK_16875 [Candidatus Electrothrix laxa]
MSILFEYLRCRFGYTHRCPPTITTMASCPNGATCNQPRVPPWEHRTPTSGSTRGVTPSWLNITPSGYVEPLTLCRGKPHVSALFEYLRCRFGYTHRCTPTITTMASCPNGATCNQPRVVTPWVHRTPTSGSTRGVTPSWLNITPSGYVEPLTLCRGRPMCLFCLNISGADSGTHTGVPLQ